eukprot:754189-Hanusia_phi.AAC.1
MPVNFGNLTALESPGCQTDRTRIPDPGRARLAKAALLAAAGLPLLASWPGGISYFGPPTVLAAGPVTVLDCSISDHATVRD